MNSKIGRKAISDIVSYVVLIVIALGLAAGIYAWLKFYATIPNDESKCSDEVSLVIKRYDCTPAVSADRVISIRLENKGLFNINGFYIKGAKSAGDLPTIGLQAIGRNFAAGEYHFESALEPAQTITANFSYARSIPLAKIQIQPFIYAEDRRSLCPNIINLDIDEERGCD